MTTYNLQKMVMGSSLGMAFIGKQIAPINEKLLKEGDVKVIYHDEYMIIKKGTKPLMYRKFADKFGRKKGYTLAYFEFKPVIIDADDENESMREAEEREVHEDPYLDDIANDNYYDK